MSSARRNILLLIPCYGFGGAQQVFHDHSVELGARFNVTEAVFNMDLPDVYPSGNPVVDLQVAGAPGVVGKLRQFWRRCQRLRALKRDKAIDLSISHLEGADYVNLLSRVGERSIAVIHGSKVHDGNIAGWLGWLRHRVLLPLCYRLPDRIVTVSRELRQELIDFYGVDAKRISVINNFFYPDRILTRANQPIEARYEPLFRSSRVMVTSGRLTIQKNQSSLVAVFAALLARRPGSKLAVLGDGELRNDLVAQAQGLGLRVYQTWNNDPLDVDYDLYFLGYQSNPFPYIRRSGLFVFPSGWEGFPMALCEAMLCGVPVVSTDCPTGPREILAPATPATQQAKATEWAEFGVLMPLLADPNREQAQDEWVSTLAALLDDAPRLAHYAGQGPLRMQAFTPEKMFQKWLTLIEDLGLNPTDAGGRGLT